jgi:hypothetical protein
MQKESWDGVSSIARPVPAQHRTTLTYIHASSGIGSRDYSVCCLVYLTTLFEIRRLNSVELEDDYERCNGRVWNRTVVICLIYLDGLSLSA